MRKIDDELIYLDHVQVGQKSGSDSHAVDEAQIRSFAAQFESQSFHLDEQAASNSLFGGLAASGLHTSSITMRLLVTSGAPIVCVWRRSSSSQSLKGVSPC